MLIEEALRLFWVALRAERGASPATLRAYQSDLKDFEIFCKKTGAILTSEKMDRALLRQFLSQWGERPYHR